METIRHLSGKSPAYRAKYLLAQTTLFTLGTVSELASKHSKDVQGEVEQWADGLVFTMGILPNGPYVTMKRQGSRISFLGLGKKNPDVCLYFKNLDAAVLSFTGQMGTHTAVAQHRMVVHGNLTEAMKISRTLDLIQTFLLPTMMLNRTSKNPVNLSLPQLWVKAKVLSRLTPWMTYKAVRQFI
jgi:transposase